MRKRFPWWVIAWLVMFAVAFAWVTLNAYYGWVFNLFK